jgi:hypothetical protein
MAPHLKTARLFPVFIQVITSYRLNGEADIRGYFYGKFLVPQF